MFMNFVDLADVSSVVSVGRLVGDSVSLALGGSDLTASSDMAVVICVMYGCCACTSYADYGSYLDSVCRVD